MKVNAVKKCCQYINSCVPLCFGSFLFLCGVINQIALVISFQSSNKSQPIFAQMSDSEKMWYFAFGSNMNPKILSGRRKVFPTQSKPAFVPGWYLNFDTTGLPYVEPSFGSIGQTQLEPNQPDVHGVVHEITRKEYQRIRLTEGGGGHENVGYGSVDMMVKTYDGQQVMASTLVETPKTSYYGQFYPSKRYMKLLEDGSVEFGLKPEYQKWLKTVPRYEHISTLRHWLGKILYLAMVIPFAVPLLLPFVYRRLRQSQRAPRWLYVLSRWEVNLFGHIYYFVFRPIFGNGAGEPSNKSYFGSISEKLVKTNNNNSK